VNIYIYFRIKFLSSDKESGVHKIGFSIIIKTTGKEDRVIYEGFAPASISNVLWFAYIHIALISFFLVFSGGLRNKM
jgi:hypothetical protein